MRQTIKNIQSFSSTQQRASEYTVTMLKLDYLLQGIGYTSEHIGIEKDIKDTTLVHLPIIIVSSNTMVALVKRFVEYLHTLRLISILYYTNKPVTIGNPLCIDDKSSCSFTEHFTKQRLIRSTARRLIRP